MTITVNGLEANPGCYIDGHWGQYGVDRIAAICEQFGCPDPESHDLPSSIVAATRVVMSNFDGWIEAGEIFTSILDECEQRLNDATVGGCWMWEDGEFYLVDNDNLEDNDE